MRAVVRLLRHRLVHFLVIGAAIAAIAPIERDPRVIALDPGRVVDALRAEEARTGRPLTTEEKKRVSDGLVDDEVLAREALRLGLGTDEPIVRARLAQQMRAQLGPRGTSGAPADTAGPRLRLAVWYAATEREAAAIALSIREAGMERARGLGARPPIPDGATWSEQDLASVVGLGAARAAFAAELKTPTPAVASAWGFYVFVPLTREEAVAAPPASDDANVDRFLRRARSEYRIEAVN